jgi:hypothetical protein
MKKIYLYIILIINNLFLFINLILKYLNLKIIEDKIRISPNFKNVDLFFINNTRKTFKQIALYLNSKYFKFNLNNNETINSNGTKFLEKNIKEKKVINIYSVGSSSTYYKNLLINDMIKLLENQYLFNFTSDNPDYLLYDVFGCEQIELKYQNAIKIAFYTENIIPDFNYADYSIGFHNINYLDRYFKKTTLIWIFQTRYLNIKNKFFETIRKKAYRNEKRKKFCAAVISNFKCTNGFRIKFINELKKYKKVDMGGSYQNNVGGNVKNKTQFLSSYKFSIAMENSEGQGYVSEKILDSFIAGTIPIYYGGYMIDEFINPKAYILIKNENDITKKIDYIKKIDNNDILYKSILKEKLFINDNLVSKFDIEKAKFFNHIFEQEKNKAKRVDSYHLI